jgi:AcrR family transcriptional regulator
VLQVVKVRCREHGEARPARPCHRPPEHAEGDPREEILEVAARLFTKQGYAATSTREIAEAVGIRQASAYYHFPSGKGEILSELLGRTVRPTLEQIDRIETVAAEHGAASALYALVMIDTGTLAEAPHNAGRLPSLPDVCSREESVPYQAIHADLVDAYARLGARVAGLDVNGILLAHLVEVVVTLRSKGLDVDEATRHIIAASALRACGATQDQITIAAAVAWAELTA